jgi:diguanylate cyclase (GGDEF)-like protein
MTSAPKSLVRSIGMSPQVDLWRRFHAHGERVQRLLDIARELGLQIQTVAAPDSDDTACIIRDRCTVCIIEPARWCPSPFRGTESDGIIAYTDLPEAIQIFDNPVTAEGAGNAGADASHGMLFFSTLRAEERISWLDLECAILRGVQFVLPQELEGEPLFMSLSDLIQTLLAPAQWEIALDSPADFWPDRAPGWIWAKAEANRTVVETVITPRLQRMLYRRENVLFIEDLALAPDVQVNSFFAMPPFRSCFLLPLAGGTRSVGVLKAFYEQTMLPLVGDMEALELLRGEMAHFLDRTRLHGRLQRMAMVDGLTNLFNHRFFREQLHTEFQRCLRYQKNMSLIMIDIDDFKGYNDKFGHLAGDRVLAETARTIRRTVRDIDFVARYGGEEFALILPEVDAQSGTIVAEKIRKAVEVQRLLSDEGEPIGEITVSCGVTDNFEATSPDDLIERADRALYWVKRHGRNLVRLASEGDHD